MPSLVTLLLSVTAWAVIPLGGSTDTPDARSGDSLVVSPEWLATRIDHPELVLLHVGPEDEYAAEHIPGARWISWRDISAGRGAAWTLQLPPVPQLVAAFERLGVSDGSRIVVYFGKGWVAPAARVMLTLEYLGLGNRTSILDGGLPAWRAAGGEVTRGRSPVQRGSLTPRPQDDVVVDLEWVRTQQRTSSVRLLDARTAEFYTGTREGRYPRAGHIPGARNIPYTVVLDASSLRLKTETELRALFEDAGTSPDELLVTYCHIGQQASLLYLVARHLGYEARMYDGSFEEWSSTAELPVRNPSQDSPREQL